MKGILGLLKSKNEKTDEDGNDSVFFTSAFASQGVDPSQIIPWEARAVEVNAKRLPTSRSGRLLQSLWANDRYMAQMPPDTVARMVRFFEFAAIAADRDVIRQGEYSSFMVVLLTGSIAVDRVQPWGEQFRLAQTRPGDILGEMSLLDGGMRFSSCTSLTDCDVAVLTAEALDDMMSQDPQLAASLVALLARKLSLRLRAVSARMSENQP